MSGLIPSPWRAWNTFIAALGGAFVALTVAMMTAGMLRISGGELNAAQIQALLRGLYWGTYPLVFLALG